MLDVNTIRKYFPMLDGKLMSGHPLVYLDNSATTFKPNAVINAIPHISVISISKIQTVFLSF